MTKTKDNVVRVGAAILSVATTVSTMLVATPTVTFSTVPIAPTTPTTQITSTKKIPRTHQLINATAKLIAGYEGSVPGTPGHLKIYRDVGGNPTACYGRLLTPTQAKAYQQQYPNGIPETICTQWLNQDTARAMQRVLDRSNPTVPMTPGQLAALTSLAYNVGNFGEGLSKNLEIGNYKLATTTSLPKYNKAIIDGKKKPVLGLTNRRQAEVHIATSGLPYYNGESLPPPAELGQSLEIVAQQINTETAKQVAEIQQKQGLEIAAQRQRDQDRLLTR
jgi:GH24 family phage-related lysozyme (muramidase)